MYINQIDNLFDNIINNLNIFLDKKKYFDKFKNTSNFVKYQNNIINEIKEFYSKINDNEIKLIVKKDSLVLRIKEILKRYIAFYIYLGVGYHYTGNRDLFITNIIEISKSQKDSTFKIDNFFNSENNNKIIEFYQIIKHLIDLNKIKDIEKVKIILLNEPIKYEETIKVFNELGEDYVNQYFLIKDNFHNIIKTFLFRFIYILDEKIDIIDMLNEKEIENAEYKFIEVVYSNRTKIIDFKIFEKLLGVDNFKKDLVNNFYNYLVENKEEDLKIVSNNDIIDFLFSQKILIPISEDFLRFHKDSEKYTKDKFTQEDNLKDRDSTKIKYVISKVNRVKNLHSKIYDKNENLRNSISSLIYKPLEQRTAILYNDNEENNVINKLENSDKTTDIDFLFDLKNIRKYAYVNFKDFSKDGFKLRPKEMIQSIRINNITSKKNVPLELRVSHPNLDINIVGVAFNPKKIPLECFKQTDLLNVKENNSENGFNKFIEKFNSSSSNLFYWLFDNKTDKVKLSEYKNLSTFDTNKYIKNILEEIFLQFQQNLENTIKNIIEKKKIRNISELDNLLKDYTNKYSLDRKINSNVTNKIRNYFIKNKLLISKNLDDKEENIKRVKLKVSNLKKEKENIIFLGEDKTKIDLDEEISKPMCYHYIKWNEINKLSKKNDTFNQEVFNFVKKYVKTNVNNDFVCKSCGELLNLKKFVYEGTYVEELDTFLTTNLAVTGNLFDIPKYKKFTRTIRNLEKNIEKICYTLNLSYYLGNTPIIKLRRRMVMKDILDLIFIHTEYLKKNFESRKKINAETYNIHKDLTNLFFFELKDEIFLTSSADTDYYKKIKYNNVIAYLIFLLIIEINTGQILQLKEDKLCNYFLFEKVGKNIFTNIFLRINEKDKIPISNLPLLCYVIFYFSCMITTNYIWLWDNQDKSQKFNTQKIIIHTIIDLINSIIEANTEKNKNFLYEIIVNRFLQKLKSVYNDKTTLNRINQEINKFVKFDKDTKKITFIKKNINNIKINGNFNYTSDFIIKLVHNKIFCNSKKIEMDKIYHHVNTSELNNLSNCINGSFHNWSFVNNDLVCSICNKKYSEVKNIKNNNPSILRELKFKKLRKIAKTYCITGKLHNYYIIIH